MPVLWYYTLTRSCPLLRHGGENCSSHLMDAYFHSHSVYTVQSMVHCMENNKFIYMFSKVYGLCVG